jgi:hypothetical protein
MGRRDGEEVGRRGRWKACVVVATPVLPGGPQVIVGIVRDTEPGGSGVRIERGHEGGAVMTILILGVV